jgi:hypothetical protein
MVARLLGRLILIPLGFVCAAIAAVAVLATLGLERATHAVHGREFPVDQIIGIASFAHGLAAAATVVPALLVILVGEVARIRSWVYWIAGGGVALAVLPLLAPTGEFHQDAAQIGVIWQVLATAGFAGGFVYWLIAGRRA